MPHGKIEEVDELKLNSFTGSEATMSTITSSSSVVKFTGTGNPAGFGTQTWHGLGTGWAEKPRCTRLDPAASHHP